MKCTTGRLPPAIPCPSMALHRHPPAPLKPRRLWRAAAALHIPASHAGVQGLAWAALGAPGVEQGLGEGGGVGGGGTQGQVPTHDGMHLGLHLPAEAPAVCEEAAHCAGEGRAEWAPSGTGGGAPAAWQRLAALLGGRQAGGPPSH